MQNVTTGLRPERSDRGSEHVFIEGVPVRSHMRLFLFTGSCLEKHSHERHAPITTPACPITLFCHSQHRNASSFSLNAYRALKKKKARRTTQTLVRPHATMSGVHLSTGVCVLTLNGPTCSTTFPQSASSAASHASIRASSSALGMGKAPTPCCSAASIDPVDSPVTCFFSRIFLYYEGICFTLRKETDR